MALIPIVSKFNLFQQIRLLLRKYRDGHTSDTTLLDGKLRIVSTLSMDAPLGQIERLQQVNADELIQITAWYNGLTGVMGALPTAYTEWLIERHYRYSDRSAKAFIDIFGHRLYCLDYLAWQKNHLYALAESQKPLPLHQGLLALSGLLTGTASPSLAKHAALFASPVRSMINLECWLSQHFGVPVQIIPFTGGWREVQAQECCQLSNPAQTLFTAPMLGRMRREAHAHFDVLLGPMSPETSQCFISSEDARLDIWSSVRNYVGPVLDFSVSLTISSADLMLRPLGQSAIGLDLCLGHNPGSYRHQVRLTAPSL
ncbi:type VI secretion system baseplate subunit TssG [Enterobacter asburiae]|nr:type VI secretion system baseplate subunit TssG [Enterobacter asburiae]